MKPRGKIASLSDARLVVARSFPVTAYEPRDTAAWDDAAGRFAGLLAVGSMAEGVR